MSKTKPESSKYNLQLDQAHSLAIGDHASYVHIENFNAASSPPPLTSREELLSAVHQASADLRNVPNKIAEIHLERKEVDQFLEWVLKAEDKERLGMLLDQPGSGKTVVMHDLLEALENEEIPTLAIKADRLSGIKNRSDLADRLGLPDVVEACIRHLATENLVVVILDQLDALSLTLSRDQTTLDVMLSTLNRLRDLDNVRIIASCRTFDLNNDPHLSTIIVDKKFNLQPLEEAQVNRILQKLKVDPAHLLEGHRALLTTPLHLDIYARIVNASEAHNATESYHTLQELYEALWQRWIKIIPPENPHPTKRTQAIYRLVKEMQSKRQITAPAAVLDDYPEAETYLERVGFIRREKGKWLFLYQTLYDYCYARRFVAEGHILSQEILDGPQGLFERSQMVQVLAYLRGANETAYRRELTNLLFAEKLHYHLRFLLIGWFGSLPVPTDDELRLARRLIKDTQDQRLFIQAISNNPDWFDRLTQDVFSHLLQSTDENLINIVINYLSIIINLRTNAVLTLLRPYLGKNETWDLRIASCLTRLNIWSDDLALDMLCDLLSRGQGGTWVTMPFLSLAASNPAEGCRALSIYLNRQLDELRSTEDFETKSHIYQWERKLFDPPNIVDFMEKTVQSAPEAIVEHLLLWYIRVVATLIEPRSNKDIYPADLIFSYGWANEHTSPGTLFAIKLSEALSYLAKTDPPQFRNIAQQLAKVEALAVQKVLAEAYLSNPEEYADDIFDYLVGDQRRLEIGDMDNPHYQSYRLFKTIFPSLDAQKRTTLEALILGLESTRTRLSLRSQELMQLRFLKSLDNPQLLGEVAYRKLQELERKFPGFKLLPPQGVQMFFAGPPIEQSAQTKMSDEAWLGAMRKYDDSGYEHHDFLKGGVYQMASDFAEHVKKDPDRFYRLAKRFDETTPLHYIAAAISGLADSNASAEWTFDLVRQFASCFEGEFRINICWSLEKLAKTGVPDDLLDLISDWALNDPDPAEELWQIIPKGSDHPYYNGDPFYHGTNSNRGAALKTVCRCALKRKPPQIERAFQLLEKAANDPSTAVRTCIIQSLGPLLNSDDERALTIFLQTLEKHLRLLESELAHRFLYWTYKRHFLEIQPVIKALLASDNAPTRQAGARLVCLAAFQHEQANDLAIKVMHGDVAMRRGAAHVYARNLAYANVSSICQTRLKQLMHDPDEQVRSYIGGCFEYLDAEQLDELRSFIDEFLESPALLARSEPLLNYLNPLAIEEHDLVLKVTNHILDAMETEDIGIHTTGIVLERGLVNLPLTVYNHTDNLKVKSQAITLFERLLMMGSRKAQQALEDWDRR